LKGGRPVNSSMFCVVERITSQKKLERQGKLKKEEKRADVLRVGGAKGMGQEGNQRC